MVGFVANIFVAAVSIAMGDVASLLYTIDFRAGAMIGMLKFTVTGVASGVDVAMLADFGVKMWAAKMIVLESISVLA